MLTRGQYCFSVRLRRRTIIIIISARRGWASGSRQYLLDILLLFIMLHRELGSP